MKYLIALILVMVGTNVFTFATTRYWTTRHVLTRAEERLNIALKKEGLEEQFYPVGRARKSSLTLAINLSGGMYFWWNEALIYWGTAVLCILSGLAVTHYEPTTKEEDC